MSKTALLFLIIFIEGYVVLACELLAIRQLIPFVGSGTEIIAIIISAVLLPLAVGYHQGGLAWRRQWRHARRRGRKPLSVRALLLKNVVSALCVLTLGLSYLFMEIFFSLMAVLDITHRLPQAAIYCTLFLVMPVFLLGQTVPLISHYFSHKRLSEITGKMLFFSTAGSFLGSVFSTIVLMMTIGVHATAIVTLSLLIVLIFLLARRLWAYETFLALCILALLLAVNGPSAMRDFHIVSDNAYNTVRITDIPEEEARILNINRSASSKISKDGKHDFPYLQYIRSNFIEPISGPEGAPRDILVIGAGGFTIGLHDTKNRYTFVDIDPDLKRTVEEHFLPAPLTPNKQFVAMSARAFVRSHTDRYDLIVIDAYTNIHSIPMECTTREFLLDVKKLLKENGVVVANIIASAALRDTFSVRYHNTFTSVFPAYIRQVLEEYAPWPGVLLKKQRPAVNNVLYIYFHQPLVEDRTVYTDDKNTYSIDR